MPDTYKVTLLCNYPDETDVEAAIPIAMTLHEIGVALNRLETEEPDITSFVLTASKMPQSR
jgi:hypothetical protein